MTVIQLWQSYTGEVITLANRNVREGLAENNVKKKNNRKKAPIDYVGSLIILYTPLLLFLPFFFFVKQKAKSKQTFQIRSGLVIFTYLLFSSAIFFLFA